MTQLPRAGSLMKDRRPEAEAVEAILAQWLRSSEHKDVQTPLIGRGLPFQFYNSHRGHLFPPDALARNLFRFLFNSATLLR